MSDDQWHAFFRMCAQTLGAGARHAWQSRSWCAWTTFPSLSDCVHYWSAGLPSEDDLSAVGTNDSGPWGQPFLYQSLAHIIIPRLFYWERGQLSSYENGFRQQDLEQLSERLSTAGIKHRLTELVLEVKLY
jgi:hypothetical protein